MADWKSPEEVVKGASVPEMDETELNKYHDQMHIFWDKIKDGHYFGWNFKEVYVMHKALVIEMMMKSIGHIHPVNDLDHVDFAADMDELIQILERIKRGEVIAN